MKVKNQLDWKKKKKYKKFKSHLVTEYCVLFVNLLLYRIKIQMLEEMKNVWIITRVGKTPTPYEFSGFGYSLCETIFGTFHRMFNFHLKANVN